MKSCYNTNYPFLNNTKDLDPSYKTDLDLWCCFGSKKLRLITEEIRYNYFLPSSLLCMKYYVLKFATSSKGGIIILIPPHLYS